MTGEDVVAYFNVGILSMYAELEASMATEVSTSHPIRMECVSRLAQSVAVEAEAEAVCMQLGLTAASLLVVSLDARHVEFS
jgi:hypothetical protein